MIKNVITIIDGAAGSCGKAKVIGEIATNKNINIGASITNCMPNSGHTFVDNLGNKIIFRNIPVSIVNPNCELFIGPGSAIDMEVFIEEYERVEHLLGNRKIYVHELVPLIEHKHKDYEKEHITSGSTFKGCAAVTKDKILRDPALKFFSGYKNAIRLSNQEWLERLYSHINTSEYIILEGSQGCDLSLNHSSNYPYVTSRNVSTSQLLADSGISPEHLLETIMVIRPFPIRISNVTEDNKYIYTGSYGNAKELTWSDINISSSNGSYPNPDLIPDIKLNKQIISYYISECPVIYLIQLFGEDYSHKKMDNITVIEALELERLVNKSKNNKSYYSYILNKNITDLSEQTTVTKKERRVFDLDIEKLKMNCLLNTPSFLYLNFFQDLDQEYYKLSGLYDEIYFNHYLREYINYLEQETNTEISTLGTGPCNNEHIIKKTLIKEIKR